MDATPDELLMARVQDGQVETLGVLYERYRLPLFNFFVRLTDNVQTSEDLVHEVFLRMLKYRHTYKPAKRFAPWMYQVARNAHADAFRKLRNETPLETDEAADRDFLASPEAAPDARLNRSQELALLQEALMNLPLESRELLVLTRFQNLSYEEIAEVLHCSLSAVKMRLHRALQELRERFAQLAGEKVV